MNTDLSTLFSTSEKTAELKLQIELLTPISMVTQLPGSYYRSVRKPDKLQLCGLFENMMGIHIGHLGRKAIFKDIQKDWKKRLGVEVISSFSGSGYQPLLHLLFDMDDSFIAPNLSSFDDMWKKSMRRTDDKAHPAGTPNLDYRLLPEKRRLAGGNHAQISNDDLTKLFKDNLDKFPFFYTTLASREYVTPADSKGDSLSRSFILRLHCTPAFAGALRQAINSSSSAYLGHSESWVELKLL
ncbi:MAG TPA: type I-PGING CRISPR-associated protein Cas5p [Saprospiraceae bacterium]|nr:type I-PGING CRISPR-associated protein Cas5p [Saprospiraceae bacterium]